MNVFITAKPFFSIMTQAEYFFFGHIHTRVLAVSLSHVPYTFLKNVLYPLRLCFFKRIFCSPLSCILRLINWKLLALPVGKLLFSVTAICQRLKNLEIFLAFQFIEYCD